MHQAVENEAALAEATADLEPLTTIKNLSPSPCERVPYKDLMTVIHHLPHDFTQR